MLKKSILPFLIILILAGAVSCRKPYLLPQPLGEISRQNVIDKHLRDKSLDDVEGLWVWADNNYEVAIIKNPSSHNQPCDYVAIVTDRRDKYWSLGETKMLLKKTAASRLFSTKYYMWAKYDVGTTLVLVHENLIEMSLPTGRYGLLRKTQLIRTYPQGKPQSAAPGSAATGTGFFISEDVVATNHHIIEGRNDITVTVSGTKIPAKILVKDMMNDLALLKVLWKTKDQQQSLGSFPVNIGDVRETKEGDKVFCVGYPLESLLGTHAKISEGIVNSVFGIKDDPREFQISIPIQPGNSGSPLFNEKGQVIGVVSARLKNLYSNSSELLVPQNVNFAVKINYLANLTSLAPDKIALKSGISTRNYTAAQIMSSHGKSVVFIEAKK